MSEGASPSSSRRADVLTRRCIGRTTLSVTELGFGSAPIGNFRFDASDADAQGALAGYWAAGGRHYDTAPFYGYGRSELRVGQFLRGIDPADYLLSTKVGRWLRPLRADDDRSGLRQGGLPFFPTYDLSYDGAMRSLEQSYLRLGLDRIDVVLIHDVDAFTHGSDAAVEPLFDEAMEGAYRALVELRRAGQIRAIGAGINDTRWCRRFVEAGDFDCMMLAGQYSLLEHSTEVLELLSLCRRKQIGVLIAGVFNSGILAGGSKSGAAFHYKPAPQAIIERVGRIEAIATAHGLPLAAAAIQFVLAHPAVSAAVLGATSLAEVQANFEAYRHPIPAAFWADLRSAGVLASRTLNPGEDTAHADR